MPARRELSGPDRQDPETIVRRLLPWAATWDQSVVRRRRGRVTLDLVLAESIGPVVVRFQEADLPRLWDLLCSNPTLLDSAIIDCLFLSDLPPIRPRPRGAHAHRAVSGRQVRWMASVTYAIIERLVDMGANSVLNAIRQDFRRRRSAETDSMRTRQGRWNKRELTAYVVEYGFGYDRKAFIGKNSPMDDPEQFYQEYVRGKSLKAAQATLARWPSAYPQIWRALGRLAPADLVERVGAAVLISSQKGESNRPNQTL